MAGTTTELLFDDELENVIDCLKFWTKEAEKVLAKDNTFTETEQVLEDSKNALHFLNEIKNNEEINTKIHEEYGGFALNKDTGLYECLFVTECSELLAKLRAREKALYYNEVGKGNYETNDIQVKTRVVRVTCDDWL